MMSTRRHFLRDLAAVAATLAIPSLAAATAGDGQPGNRYALFTKHFLGLDHRRLADILASLGVTSIEAPIRPKGHVEPERVADELPRFVEILKGRGITISVISSGINAVAPEQHTEKVLRTAKSLGIPRYRMNWYFYDLKKPIWPQLDEIRPRLKDLVAFSKEVGILPCYQNHSGRNYVGAARLGHGALDARLPADGTGLVLRSHARHDRGDPVLADRPEPGAAITSRWRTSRTSCGRAKASRTSRWGKGSSTRDMSTCSRSSGFRGPVTLHVEYLEHLPRDGSYLDKAIAATRRDLDGPQVLVGVRSGFPCLTRIRAPDAARTAPRAGRSPPA